MSTTGKETQTITLDNHLQLPPEYIDALRQHAAASGEDLDACVSQIVADNLQAEITATRRSNGQPQNFGEWLKAWADRHPRLDHDIDDSRESIYADCVE